MRKVIILLLTILLQCFSVRLTATDSYAPVFAVFPEQKNGIVDANTVGKALAEIEIAFPDSKIYIFIRITDSSGVAPVGKNTFQSKDLRYYKADSADNEAAYYAITAYPSLLALNFNGNEIARFEGEELQDFSADNLKEKFRTMAIASALPVSYPIGQPKTGSIVLKNGIVHYVDLKNFSIGEFDIRTGDSITTIAPDRKFRKFVLDNSPIEDISNFKYEEFPPVNFNYAYPIRKDELLCLCTNWDSCSGNSCKLVKKKFILVTLKNNKPVSVDTFIDNKYSIKQLHQLSNGEMICDLNFADRAKLKTDVSLYDSIFLYAKFPNNDFDKIDYLLPLGLLRRSYKDKALNINSTGLLEYNRKQGHYIYLNPWMGVFVKYRTERDSLEKIAPQGLLRSIFNDWKASPLCLPEYSSYEYILMDWYFSEDKFNVLIQPWNKDSYSNFFIVDTYSSNGDFLYETRWQYQDPDRIHLVYPFSNATGNGAWFLINSEKRRWQLVKLN